MIFLKTFPLSTKITSIKLKSNECL